MSEVFETTQDAFLGGRVQVRQPVQGFRSGLDAVLLAAACPAKAGDNVLEAGSGVGVASLCLGARVGHLALTGVDLDSGLIGLARKNAQVNDFSKDYRFIAADISAPWTHLAELGLARESYRNVIANPPFYAEGEGRPPKHERRSQAHVMEKGGLERWLRFLAAVCASDGSCTVIHRADALNDLLAAFEGRFGGVSVRPVYAKASEAAIRVILTGRKGSRAPLTIVPGLVLHDENGAPSEAALRLTRDGKALI